MDHAIAYIHMPVPGDRHDDAYFAPLARLETRPDTEIYLGLIHKDDVEGTRRRMAAGGKYLKDYGVATECGMARARDKATAQGLLQIHADVTRDPG